MRRIRVYRKKTNATVIVPFSPERTTAVTMRVLGGKIAKTNLDDAVFIESALKQGIPVVAYGYSACILSK